MWTLVAARAVAGLGGGGINTLTTVITSDLVPLRQRGKYQGYGNMAYGVSSSSLFSIEQKGKGSVNKNMVWGSKSYFLQIYMYMH